MISVKNTQVGRSPIEVTLNDVSELLTMDAAHALLESLNDVLGAGVSKWAIKPVSIKTFAREYMRIEDTGDMDVLNAIFSKGETFFGEFEVDMFKDMILLSLNYTIYLWCCLADPQKYFVIPPHKSFDIVSMVSAQFYRDITRTLRNTVDPETGHNWYESKTGVVLPNDRGMPKSISIPNRISGRGSLRVFNAQPNGMSIEGFNLWVSILKRPYTEKEGILYGRARVNQLTRYSEGRRLMLKYVGE